MMTKNKWIIPSILAAIMLGATVIAVFPVGTLLAEDHGSGQMTQADQGLVSFVTGDTAGYCGSSKEPWILNVAADGGSGGALVLTFNDGDSVSYPIAVGTSFSAQFNFGGVPGVDNVVKISATGGVAAVVITALATSNAHDPFTGDGQKDNFCVVFAPIGPSEVSPTSALVTTFTTGAATYSVA